MRKLAMTWLAVAACLLMGADWTQFRNDGRSVNDAPLPTEWSVEEGSWKNIAWRADLPARGPSSPIVVGKQVIVTASGGFNQDRIMVLSFDADTGREQWRREFWATGRTGSHPSSANAAPTPASDGKRIFAFYSSNDLVCLDLKGNLLWYRGLAYDYPKAGNDVGMASSPFVVAGTVVVQIENQGDSFVAGIDAEAGQTRWRHARQPQASWSSPVGVASGVGGNPTVYIQSPDGVAAHHAVSGEQLWKYSVECDRISSPVATASRLFVAADGLTGLSLDESAEPTVLWKANAMAPASTSPVLYKGRIYSTNRAGVLGCVDAETGESPWKNKLRLAGRFWATHAVANDHMYCFNSDGKALVVKLGDTAGEVVFECDFGEGFQGSPAIAGKAIYVRSDGHLWKIARQP